MFRVRPLIAAIVGLMSLVLSSAATAAPATPDKNAGAEVQLVRPTSIRRLQNLDFAYITVIGAGTATIDPNTDQMTTTGGAIHVTGTPYAALFNAVSPTSTVVIIRIPRQPITLTRVGGTETMTVSDWTLSGPARRTVVSREPFDFRVGGTLTVDAGQAEGLYTGTFDVEIQYP